MTRKLDGLLKTENGGEGQNFTTKNSLTAYRTGLYLVHSPYTVGTRTQHDIIRREHESEYCNVVSLRVEYGLEFASENIPLRTPLYSYPASTENQLKEAPRPPRCRIPATHLTFDLLNGLVTFPKRQSSL